MKKLRIEGWITVAAIAFLLSWFIDNVTGPVSIIIKNPVSFLTSSVILNKYPFTATSVFIRAIALFISSMLVMSAIRNKYFTKVVILFFVGLLAEFYAIQQLATGYRLTNIQWTLSIAYGSLLLIPGIAYLILKGIWSMFNKETPKQEVPKEESVLNPPESHS